MTLLRRIGSTLTAVIVAVVVFGLGRIDAQSGATEAALHLRVALKAVDDGNFEIALDEVTAAAKLAPADATIQFVLATILDKRDKTDAALAALARAESLGLPAAYKSKVDDLQASLVYKQKKQQAAEAERTRNEEAERTRRAAEEAERTRREAINAAWALPPPGKIITTKVTKEDGKYSVSVPSGRAIVEFKLNGFSAVRYEVSGSQGAAVDVALPVGAEVITNRVAKGSGGSLRGKVTDESGSPLPGVTITVTVITP